MTLGGPLQSTFRTGPDVGAIVGFVVVSVSPSQAHHPNRRPNAPFVGRLFSWARPILSKHQAFSSTSQYSSNQDFSRTSDCGGCAPLPLNRKLPFALQSSHP